MNVYAYSCRQSPWKSSIWAEFDLVLNLPAVIFLYLTWSWET